LLPLIDLSASASEAESIELIANQIAPPNHFYM
jgi:hypothetical protein